MAGAEDTVAERRRVEVWRDGAWRASRLPELAVGEVFRMFEEDGSLVEPQAPFARVLAPAREREDMPGRYSVMAEDCADPSAAPAAAGGA